MVRIHLHPQGTRVRIRHGDFPIDPTLVGREGTVLVLDGRVPGRYHVQLDGEERLRAFDESELEPFSGHGSAGTASTAEAGTHGGGAAAS
jgi:hypothetical protein